MISPEESYFKQPVWKLHETPCTLDVPTVQHGTLSATGVVTLDTGSQSAEEVPLPTNRMDKHNTPRKAKSTIEKGHTDIIKMEEVDG